MFQEIGVLEHYKTDANKHRNSRTTGQTVHLSPREFPERYRVGSLSDQFSMFTK